MRNKSNDELEKVIEMLGEGTAQAIIVYLR